MTELENLPLRRKKSVIIVLSLIIIAILIFHPHTHRERNQTISVNTVAVKEKAMPLILQASGTAEPSKTVDIRAQITGTLEKIDFIAGQEVKSGQTLFEIDAKPYIAKLNQASAVLAGDEAQLKATKADEKRFSALAKLGAVSKQDEDQIEAKLATAAATVQSDKEKVNEAQIDLQYTKIAAPIAGKAGDISSKEGDLVTAASNAALVNISQMNPILVDFHIPQDKLTAVLSWQNRSPLAVEIWNENQQQLLGRGTLVFIDNAVDKNTGTVLLKGSIDNTQKLLWPGLMVNVKLLLTTEEHALVIPIQAVKIGQNGNFVYLAKDNHALIKKINVVRQVDDLAVISGLAVGDQVITVAPPNIENRSIIKINNKNIQS